MPNSHFLMLCGGFTFGSLIAEYLKRIGYVEYGFFVSSIPTNEHLIFSVYQNIIFWVAVFFLSSRIKLSSSYFTNWNILEFNRRIQVFVFSVLLIFSLFLTWFYYDEMILSVVERHTGNHAMARISIFLSLVALVVFHSSKELIKWFAYILILYCGTLPGSIDSSRSVAIPFILIFLSFLQKRQFLLASLFFYFSFVAISAAFAGRGYPSYANYWNIFFEKLFLMDLFGYMKPAIQYSFPGLSTIQASFLAPGEFSIDSVFSFLIYISPFPSWVLPDEIFSGLSLSYALGIDRSVLGINYDIFSEGIYWFGSDFAFLYTMTLALMVVLPYYVSRKFFINPPKSLYVFILMANVWMLYGGQVFALRAATRPMIALLLVMCIVVFFRKYKFKAINYKY